MNLIISSLGLMFIISALLTLNPRNKYSLYTKMLKFFPKLILGVALISFPLIGIDQFNVGILLGFSFIFIFSEIIIQLMNIHYGRL